MENQRKNEPKRKNEKMKKMKKKHFFLVSFVSNYKKAPPLCARQWVKVVFTMAPAKHNGL